MKNSRSSKGKSMGRRRWWRGTELLLLCVLLNGIKADGEVGCLFSENLCDPATETCYNDLAFGRCISLYTNLQREDLEQYNLDPEELELLRLQLERLEYNGYTWQHPYTQCIVQSSLNTLRYGIESDYELCRGLKKHNENHIVSEDNQIDRDATSQPIAVVKFTPSEDDPHGDFADELYYPPIIGNDPVPYKEYPYSPHKDNRKETNTYQEINNLEDSYYDGNRKLKKKSLDPYEQEYRHLHGGHPSILQDESVRRILANERIIDQLTRVNENTRTDWDFSRDNTERMRDDIEDQSNEDYEKTFTRKYKYPKTYSQVEFLNKNPIWLNTDFVDEDNRQEINEKQQQELMDEQVIDTLSRQNGMYTEGGLVQPLRHSVRPENAADLVFDDDLNALLLRQELAGFKRRERLDVKKPGPPFATNNYAFKTQSPPITLEEENSNGQNDILYPPLTKKEVKDNAGISKPSENSYKNVDLDHVYIEFENTFLTWAEGEHVVKEVGKLLGLNTGALTDIRVGRAEVTFKVTENQKNYNASDVVNRIDEIRGPLKEALQVEVVRAGIGDKVKLPATLEVKSVQSMSSGTFHAIIAGGAAAAGAAAVVTILIARRHAKYRAKVMALATSDPEASKDYQDLCRARMQAKQPTEKPDSPRIISLSRESESNNSPSSRSSTSSWSEEPALSNMDISTGHMVLSYMEDHLKNKDRLDQEWIALCTYEAEPSSTAIAEDTSNQGRNRSGAALPYDHSRVVLNDLANANGTDYINASTITDHDPRNPAYIATQGPLPQTAADFWQLVWEQGSVVIVMLTRLTEEGRAMCHRYWPEEGSECYHIYEVHLVSEHIWCDDYLVRSFYLKNLRTGETRTVTQFHFLSWPENGVPHSTKALLEFRRKVNKSYRGRSCPIVVHCSDGAGRTGTYCLIDMVLNRMAKGAKEIDIAATLEHIRDQRPGMVATKQQFEFVLMAVAEEVHAILKALPIPPAEKSPAPTSTSTSAPPAKNEQ
ncbi:receptor-type tyrosine-protein phosphatase N2 isoform X2 [Cephus cinctus]|uniref:Receptor-type tyrosine-protein phosphatase N2 isoform X2 n=1 Tax=Cephus cinctus TaxID=211228 RepID=A0AAJ7R8W1_CEPCN|nr:receptor-type tyrosine-protein phosphatase N2 isoform X2 [Cephus cinctus]